MGNYRAKSIPGWCQLMPSEMMLVIAGGWCCSGGKAADSSSPYRVRRAGKDSLSAQRMEQAEEQGCRGAVVDRGGAKASCSGLGLWKGAKVIPCTP